jgi:serine/threonine protein kinase
VSSAGGEGVPGETLGRYRLMKKIARGGMAEVFAARSFGAHGFEKTVAIKRILPRYGDDPQFVRMMVDEAKITVLLNHPNVATILELCEQEGDYFIVMEFVPGQSLSGLGKKLRDKGERLGVLESCFIVVELLQGLHAAHVQRDNTGRSANIIHRDVSPQNVLVSFDGHVKVIDFGIARAKHRLEMTEVGTIKGKLRYLAPEMIDPGRFMKSGDFDHRVDVFAAGIVLWELIAHRTLYQGDDEMVVYDAITDSDAPDLGKMGMCDGALAKIVAKALVREPDKRYLSAEEFADDLRAYVYRTDPAFTHKRISSVMERLFPAEKEEMAALERGSSPHSGPNMKAPREETSAGDRPRRRPRRRQRRDAHAARHRLRSARQGAHVAQAQRRQTRCDQADAHGRVVQEDARSAARQGRAHW